MTGALAIALGAVPSCKLAFDPQRLALECSSRGLITRSRTYELSEGLGCGTNPGRCLTVVRPHLFAATTRGLSFLDLSTSAPPTALDFAPAEPAVPWFFRGVAASGPNVFFAAGPEGDVNAPTGETLPLLVGSFAAPGPSGAAIQVDARDVFQGTTTRYEGIFPAPADQAFLVTQNTATAVTRPASTGPALTSPGKWPFTLAASGGRLVARDGGTYLLLQNAGRPGAQTKGAPLPVREEGEDFGDLAQYADGPTGAVVSAVPVTRVLPDSGGNKEITALRLVWLLRDDRDTSFTAPERLTVATYDPPLLSAELDGPLANAAIVSYDRAVIVVPDAANRTQSRVLVVTRATTPPSVVQGLEAALPYSASRVFPVAADGVVYAVALRGGGSIEVFTLGASCTP